MYSLRPLLKRLQVCGILQVYRVLPAIAPVAVSAFVAAGAPAGCCLRLLFQVLLFLCDCEWCRPVVSSVTGLLGGGVGVAPCDALNLQLPRSSG